MEFECEYSDSFEVFFADIFTENNKPKRLLEE
jgi:hypothetical protein